jgi:hypothetical protein
MFKQKVWLVLLLFSHVSMAIADDDIVTCPSVAEIRRDAFNYWLPLYKEGEELASNQDVETFRKHVVNFEIGRWSTGYLDSAHCFYQGTDPMVSKIVLAQKTWQPVMNPHWFWRKPEHFAECLTTNLDDCRFIK